MDQTQSPQELSLTAAAFIASGDALKDKVIAITGAGDGIGKVAALSCAAHGATVILLGRTIPKLEQVYDEIEAAGHPQAAIFPINLEGAVEKDYNDMADAIDAEFGRLDGLLHNAAQLGPQTPLSNYEIDTWQKLMQVNVTAGFMMTKALLPLLEKSSAASVVFTSSSVGRKGRAYWGAYAISKAAVENMVQVFADEMDGINKVRVNCINPGATRTQMRASAYPSENPATLKTAAEIMPSYLYLLSPKSEALNGISIDAQPK
ncbi:YciK family oxidoreductase [uncultured Pseudoteredinibacter sp.]|uniref:YciK family oxidoreductase n=1 Tax=uncultured Pseudoteredinibacter sp. TaxID=1641701 RepID=UPI00260EE624|nr:YciK family oxidoreductase [uncultured Pseudoteredinibacter sp.]